MESPLSKMVMNFDHKSEAPQDHPPRPETPRPGTPRPEIRIPPTPQKMTPKKKFKDRVPPEHVDFDVMVAKNNPAYICSQSHTYRVMANGRIKIVKDRRSIGFA
ncbi:hypothetical protein O181_007525 [Austropuccinia psidii MF-1]|uniref:Uncharacterized protein n=1 Tax=Austropuccinia psidii MF-1 TaxID=1389203 RepID=A0A9Q3BMK5_9BASI|nr:hypothetical protein [Austropuccinia psidii MF-1]